MRRKYKVKKSCFGGYVLYEKWCYNIGPANSCTPTWWKVARVNNIFAIRKYKDSLSGYENKYRKRMNGENTEMYFRKLLKDQK